MAMPQSDEKIEAIKRSRHMNCFVGNYRRKVSAAGVLRLPKDWLPGIGDTVYLLREKSSGRILLLPRCEFSKCARAMQNNCCALSIAKAGSLALGDSLPETAQNGGSVILRGCLRYIELCAAVVQHRAVSLRVERKRRARSI